MNPAEQVTIGRPTELEDRKRLVFYGAASHRQRVDELISGLEMSRSAWLRGVIESATVEQDGGQRYIVSRVAIPE